MLARIPQFQILFSDSSEYGAVQGESLVHVQSPVKSIRKLQYLQ